MTNNEQKRNVLLPLIIFSVYLYTAWFIYHFFIIGYINNIPSDILSGILNDGICKNLIWTLPAFILIKKYSDCIAYSPSDLFSIKKADLKYFLLAPVFLLYILFGLWVRKAPITFSLTSKQIITVLFVGLTEEIVFRGWLLNATLPFAKQNSDSGEISTSQYIMIAINAVMFLCIHFPRWLTEGVFVQNMVSMAFLSIIVLSVVFSIVFIKTKSLVIPILLHMFWDLIVFGVS